MTDKRAIPHLEKLGLNLGDLSTEELASRNKQDLANAAKYKKNTTTPASIRASYQNQIIIRQNELLHRQNEQILQLLQNMNSSESDNAPNTHNPTSTNTSDTPSDDSRFFS